MWHSVLLKDWPLAQDVATAPSRCIVIAPVGQGWTHGPRQAKMKGLLFQRAAPL